MVLEIIPYQNENLPEVQLPDQEFLHVLGEQGVRKLISDHYNLIRKSTINHLFAQETDEFEKAKLRSSDFFIQIMGGHPYFNENRGKPMLGQRHAPFKISPQARIVWLECFREALSSMYIDDKLLASFWYYLNVLSMRFVNSDDNK